MAEKKGKELPPVFEKFSTRLKKTLVVACQAALANKNDEVGVDHLLWGMVSQRGSIAREILLKAGVSQEQLAKKLGLKIDGQEAGGIGKILGVLTGKKGEGKLVLADDTREIFMRALKLGKKFGHRYIGTEHLLMAYIQADDPKVRKLLMELSADEGFIKQQVEMVIKSTSRFGEITEMFEDNSSAESDAAAAMGMPGAMGLPGQEEGKNKVELEDFCVELTDKKYQTKVDPVIGRAEEIERMISILSRRKKNNPLLVGEPGTGKTAIVEGLAKRIVENDVPEAIKGKKIYSLDLAKVIAGTIFRGEFEGRLKGLLEELEARDDAVLFIDEIHAIMGLGNASGGMDMANILKPMLSSGQLQLVGATTFDEYRKHIENDAAMSRRFQMVKVSEVTEDEAIQILAGLRERYENYHQIRISDEAIEAAVKLTNRYVQDKNLPDKAIDALDEAAAKLKVAGSADSKKKRVATLSEELAKLKKTKQKAVLNEDYNKAVLAREKEKKIKDELHQIAGKGGDDRRSWKVIGAEEIARTVSDIAKVPVEKVIKEEKRKLLSLDKNLKTRVIGQDEAVETVAKFIRRSRAGIADSDRPIGSFMFLGPTGVGKTELAKALANEVFDGEESMIRVDMSEFTEKFNISKMIGSPAGYVGYDEGGGLTEAVKKKPYAVVLFDEIEKAHPDVFNLLLQVLDEGRLTDARGKKIDFRNAIIIMTSNTGTSSVLKRGGIGFEDEDEMGKDEDKWIKEKHFEYEEKIRKELEGSFKPEFLNRIDRVLIFKPLGKKAIGEIVNLQLADLEKRLTEKGIKIKVSARAKAELIAKGFDFEKGARPLKRAIQELIEDQLAEGILKEDFGEGDLVKVGVGSGNQLFSFKRG